MYLHGIFSLQWKFHSASYLWNCKNHKNRRNLIQFLHGEKRSLIKRYKHEKYLREIVWLNQCFELLSTLKPVSFQFWILNSFSSGNTKEVYKNFKQNILKGPHLVKEVTYITLTMFHNDVTIQICRLPFSLVKVTLANNTFIWLKVCCGGEYDKIKCRVDYMYIVNITKTQLHLLYSVMSLL